MVKIRVLEGQQLANETEGGVYKAGETVDVDAAAAERAVRMGVAEKVKVKPAAPAAKKSTEKPAG